MAERFWKKPSFWKAISDTTILIFFLGFFTNTIGKEFYPIAAILVIPGLVTSIIFITKS